jgi:hypothetical protein
MRSVFARVSTSTSALLLLAGTAAANPVPWVNIGPAIGSRGWYGEGTNTVVVTPAVPAGAPFNYMTFTGTLTSTGVGSWPCEACVEVTMPNGMQFVLKPFTQNSTYTTVNATANVTIPLGGFFGSGGATLRFFELYRDSTTGPDANWTNIQITLHNPAGGDATPMDANIAPTANGPDVSAVWQLPCYKGLTTGPVLVPFATNMVAGHARMRGFGTAGGGWPATSNSASQLSFLRVNITANKADNSGPVTWTVVPFGTYAASSTQFDIPADPPVPVLTGPGNDWSVTVTDATAPAAANQFIGQVFVSFQPLLPDAPGSTDLGVIRSRPALGPVDATSVNTFTLTQAANSITWYRFTTEHPCSDASGYWMDIHTFQPAGSALNDTMLAIYDDTGHFVTYDDDRGSSLMSILTMGQTSPVRPPVDPTNSPSPRDGSCGPLGAGLHYLAVTQFSANFRSTGWFVTSDGTDVGDTRVEFRTNLPPLIPPFTDLGTLAGSLPAPAIVNLGGGTQVQWYRFDTPQPINNVTRFYLDIDTIQVGAPFVDTMIALYDHDGVVRTVDDDDGANGNRSQLSYGIGPANRASINGSLPGDGRDGDLAAGRYYIAAALWPTSFANEWVVAPAGGTASFPLNLHHNFPSMGCGPADVGSAGGAPGADGLLNNNDFIAFITFFFNNDPHADVGMAGGVVGSDGLYNNNDFIAFITLFFNGCP